jgi:putative methionine-R-sulfoxide reductase with GAF domain
LNGDGVVDKNLTYSCEAGLTYFMVPLRLDNGMILGYVILGPVVLIGRQSKEEYEAVADKLYLNLEEFWSAFIEIKVVSLRGMQSLVELVSDVSKYIINLSFQNALKEKGPAPDLAYPKLKNVLSVLLDAACDISHADIGSVMFVDEGRQNLTIQASKGIPDDITKKTRVRIGEGISGMVARDGHSFLIDENTQNNRITPYLSRPYLGSSMVLPIKINERVVGVMNLGALKDSLVKFDQTNVQAMDKLLDLVAAAVSTCP